MEEWGKLLKEARQKKNISLKEAEETTKIQRIYLQALEEEDLERLPEKVYTLGFVRTYARFLGLDPEPFVETLRARYSQNEPFFKEEVPLEKRGKAIKRLSPLFILIIIIGLLTFAFVGLGYFIGFFPLTAEEPSPLPLPPGEVIEEKEENGEEETEEEPAEEEVIPQKLTVELMVPQKPGAICWVRVKSDGKTEFEGILEAGERRFFEAKEEMEIRMGDAGNLSITVNGQDLGIQGEAGSVVTKTFHLEDFQ